jgi:hypothetical protein
MVLRKIFGPKREEVTWDWTKLHNEEIHDSYCTEIITRVIKWWMRWVGHKACVGKNRGAYMFLVGKPERTYTVWRTVV